MNIVEKLVSNLIERNAWERALKELEKSTPKFIGDKDNPMEVFEYVSKYNIIPIQIITNEDGTYTNIYEGGLKVCIEPNLICLPNLKNLDNEEKTKTLVKK